MSAENDHLAAVWRDEFSFLLTLVACRLKSVTYQAAIYILGHLL